MLLQLSRLGPRGRGIIAGRLTSRLAKSPVDRTVSDADANTKVDGTFGRFPFIARLRRFGTLNVVWMEREFDAYKLSRSMYPSIFNSFPVILAVCGKDAQPGVQGDFTVR